MRIPALSTLALSAALAFAGAAHAQDNPMVGGAPMMADRNIVENAVNSADHTTLVAAVQAAGLVETLQGAGPFTVFAPTNAAFDMLPDGTVDTLLMEENRDQLTGVLTYHVVAGNLSGPELGRMAQMGGDDAMLTTVQGGMLTVVPSGEGIAVVDANGNEAVVTIADVNQSNGVIHVINAVLLPAM